MIRPSLMYMQPRSKGELPRLYPADVHVDLNLGLIRRLLFWVELCA